jgi:voltage-gated potassium channel
MSTRRRVWEVVEVAREGDVWSRRCDAFLLALIALNVAAVMLETVQPVRERFATALLRFEIFSVGVFTVEYVARLWSCVEDRRFSAPVSGRLRFALGPMSVVDLLAVLPSWLGFMGFDLRFLRALRMFRLARVAKAARYVRAIQLLGGVLRDRREELVVTTGLLLVLMVLSGSVVYYAENPSQPEAFSSIPVSLWWAVATLTTVGYGDIYPITALGRLAGAITAMLGVGLLALPTAILGSGLVEALQHARRPRSCPHCGEPLP